MPQRVEGSIEVEAPAQQVYEYWHTLENLPQFMTNVEEIRSTGPDTTHWRGKGPLRARPPVSTRNTPDRPNLVNGWDNTDTDDPPPGPACCPLATVNRTI